MKSTSVLKDFESTLLNVFSNENKECALLYESMSYSVSAGGKRFRPNLMFSSARMLGVDPYLLFDLAIAIELIHTYSLIHDDMPCLDDDDTRRGVATNHIVYGEAMALLAGDNLQSLAFEYIYRAIENNCDPLVLKYFSRSCKRMVEGQSIDIDESYKTSVEKLEYVHLLKTGALIEFCIIAPLFFSKDYQYLESLLSVGENLGIAFQIKDDILDVTSSIEELGKSNSDLENEKQTYTSMLGLDMSNDKLNNKIEEVRKILNGMDCNFEELEEIIEFSLNRKK